MMQKIQSSQKGFTLIELVVVIVILGILAATAIPKFVDLSSDAYHAAAEGYAGALNGANSINVAGCAAKGGTAFTNVCVKVAKCTDLKDLVSPAIAITVGTVPAKTTAKTFYMAADTASTTAGATCTLVYGDGGAGQSVTYIATTT